LIASRGRRASRARWLIGSVALAGFTIVATGCDGGDDSGAADPGTETVDPTGSPGCGVNAPAPGLHERSLTFQGYDRAYRLWIPDRYDPDAPAPVVLNLHGFTSNAPQQDASTDLPAAAGARGYVVVSPQGLPIGSAPEVPTGGANFWSATPTPGPEAIDDVGYLEAVLDATERELCIDVDREYSAGMSNGAMMSVALGCAIPDRIAAIAPVAGVNLVDCEPTAPVPMITLHGTSDDLAVYDRSVDPEGVPVVGRVARWATANGCDPEPELGEAPNGVELRRWTGCPPGVDVELYTVVDGEHRWPGGSGQPAVIDATEIILDFFDAHARAGES
jgi:polyhydroxybutyrate depolymerase